MALNPIRNYLKERLVRQQLENKVYSKYKDEGFHPLLRDVKDAKSIANSIRNKPEEERKLRVFQSIKDKILNEFEFSDIKRNEPFEFFGPLLTEVPDDWKPVPGIEQVPYRFHRGRDITSDDKVPETGYKMHPLIKYLLIHKYPHLYGEMLKWCRPLGTTKATFNDFNREQYPCDPLDPLRAERIVEHVKRVLNATPFLPLHYVDTFSAKMPLGTGTGYHNRHSYMIKAHAKYFSHPEEYKDKPTSKGYVLNAFTEVARTHVHYIKYNGWPFPLKSGLSEPQIDKLMQDFTNKYPTMLFTRCHISKLADKLKQRPVYAVDDMFLIIECMLTFPLHVQARSMESAIMYGIETIRGGCAYLDKVAQNYKSYFCIDWSAFDQTVPWIIVETFFKLFLPTLLIINKGYQPTFEYPEYPDLEAESFGDRINNLLNFIEWWYYNMTFVSQHGYGYKRTCAGIPSGMLNTQYLDSYCNAFVLIDSLIEFGCTDAEIREIRLFIMGDDNTGFTHWNLTKLEDFFKFLVTYANDRYHMTVSDKKSIITTLRNKISVLSYEINFGRPKRDKFKLLAQLCYPERGVIDKWMSMRAIGIAYASCGMDLDVYNFCKDVFHTFLPYAEEPKEEQLAAFQRYLPGIMRTYDEVPDFMAILKFPEFLDIVNETHRWHGPLDTHPKWDKSHFIKECNEEYDNIMTLADWRQTFK